MVEDICTYYIEIRGQVDEKDICASSPLKLVIERADENSTTLSACTDQSGFIGLIRYLHNMGFVLLSFSTSAAQPHSNGF